MIHINDKHECCGCSACAQRCPKQCISMKEDGEGFLYPFVNPKNCTKCGVCEKVCPVLNQADERKPLECYAAVNLSDTIRLKSSSGGVFYPIAERIIRDGGVVFGARFNDNWEVIHAPAESLVDLKTFQGSKYVQSRIDTCFSEAEEYLRIGRKVLFSGTPCQVVALRRFLRKEYDNLITIDVVCHGAPSPMVWRDYIASLPMDGVAQVCMKDKRTGWKKYSFSLLDAEGKVLKSEKASVNKYMMAYLRNLIVRPSCFKCPAKAGRSQSDITLADYWGIEKILPSMNDNKGTSFVCANTKRGVALLKSLDLNMVTTDYNASATFNPCIYKSTLEPPERVGFWEIYEHHGVSTLLSLKPLKRNIIKTIINKIIG